MVFIIVYFRKHRPQLFGPEFRLVLVAYFAEQGIDAGIILFISEFAIGGELADFVLKFGDVVGAGYGCIEICEVQKVP